jgi:uncharacterized heparinase superfamily protein
MASMVDPVTHSGRPRPRAVEGSGLRRILLGTRLYRATLAGPAPKRLTGRPPHLWPGRPDNGMRLLEGTFEAARHTLPFATFAEPPPDAPPEWLAEMHRFGWLADLRAVGSDEARRRAAQLVADWIAHCDRWSPVAWRADVLGDRLINWLTHFNMLGPVTAGRGGLLGTVAAQARHLRRVLPCKEANAGHLRAIKAFLVCAVCLDGHAPWIGKALALLESEIARQILADGGHIERNPVVQLAVLRDCVETRALLGAARLEVPAWLQGAIDRMAPMLRAFRHGDGGLALFNGAIEGDPRRVDAVLALAKVRSRALSSAPHSGFQRLAGGRTVLLVDTGPPAPPETGRPRCAGMLSFEMSVGRQRVVVNCGAPPGGDPAWSEALRSTSAHSTVTVDDTNSVDISAGRRARHDPIEVVGSRREAEGQVLVEARHDGYRRLKGAVHHRFLYLDADGSDVRGEDQVLGGGERMTARFHLHPNIRASLVQDGAAVLLRLPSGEGWRFQASDGELSLEESVYAGDGTIRRANQMVVSASIPAAGAVVKWRLARL